MSTITVIYALTNPDLDALSIFSKHLKEYGRPEVTYVIGVATEFAVEHMPFVRAYSPGTSESEIQNRLVAESGTEKYILNDGAVHLNLSEETWELLSNEVSGCFYVVDGRRLVTTLDAEDPELGEMIKHGEFGRGYHADSPLSVCVSRSDFLKIRGFDERASFNSCRTMDLLARFRRAGSRRIDLDSFDNYSVSLAGVIKGLTHEKLPLSVTVRENQKAQVQSDLSIYRNLERWSVPRSLRPVLVSVAVATRDRAEYLSDCINSVLAQTFEDFELIIVDDGSEDDTQEVVNQFRDPRIRYLYQAPSGISAARNNAADSSNGYYTAVHDDDDIMLPWRLQASLSGLTSQAHASYGSWVNFDNESGEMALHITKLGFGRELVAFSGQTPGHATWLLPTNVIRAIRYDERLSSSVDHNLAVRTVMSGLRWTHTEKVLFLRRLHPSQVSQTDARRQRAAAVLSRYANSFTADFNAMRAMTEHGKALKFPNPADKTKLFEQFGAYLPDHLIRRGMVIQGLVGKKVLALDLHDRFEFIAAETDLLTSKTTLELGGADDILWEDIVRLRKMGIIGCRFSATLRRDLPLIPGENDRVKPVRAVLHERQAREIQRIAQAHPAGVMVRLDVEGDDAARVLDGAGGVFSAKQFSVNYGEYERESFTMLGFRDLAVARKCLDANSHFITAWKIFAPSNRDFSVLFNQL